MKLSTGGFTYLTSFLSNVILLLKHSNLMLFFIDPNLTQDVFINGGVTNTIFTFTVKGFFPKNGALIYKLPKQTQYYSSLGLN